MTNNKRFKKLSIILVVAMLLSLIPATLGFAQAPDTSKVEAFVSRLYTVALNRDAEPAGLAYWTAQLATRKQTASQAIRWIMLESPEFTGRNLTDALFVEVAYKTFFVRAPEAVGKAYWLGELTKGYSRNYVIKAMINAPTMEFQNMCKVAGIVVGNIRVIVADYPSSTSAPTATPTPYYGGDNSTSYPAPVVTPTPTPVAVSAINVTGTGDVTTVKNGITLQMSAAITPTNATNKTIAWSVTNGTGSATISTTGLLTATGVGTVTITATNAASGVTGTKMISVTEDTATASVEFNTEVFSSIKKITVTSTPIENVVKFRVTGSTTVADLGKAITVMLTEDKVIVELLATDGTTVLATGELLVNNVGENLSFEVTPSVSVQNTAIASVEFNTEVFSSIKKITVTATTVENATKFMVTGNTTVANFGTSITAMLTGVTATVELLAENGTTVLATGELTVDVAASSVSFNVN